VTIDRTIVAHGVHTDGAGHSHDGHDHDHVSASFVAMQKQAAAEEVGNKSSYGMVARSVVSEPSDGAAAGGDKPLEKTAIEVHQCGADEVAVTAKVARREAAMKAWVFFVALSLHSIMDGLSLGSERDINSFYAILVAVLAHKAFDGIALGVPVYLAQMPPLQTWGTLLFCAFMTPLGVGIGWAASEGSKGPQAMLASALIVSISAGSFLYISIMELLPASLHDGRYLPLKLFVFLVGFVAMAIIRAYIH
jgi:zinc transporter ZupT